MGHLTGLARINPHQFIKFDTSTGKLEAVSPQAFFAAQQTKE
jgi:hypothetical protein